MPDALLFFIFLIPLLTNGYGSETSRRLKHGPSQMVSFSRLGGGVRMQFELNHGLLALFLSSSEDRNKTRGSCYAYFEAFYIGNVERSTCTIPSCKIQLMTS